MEVAQNHQKKKKLHMVIFLTHGFCVQRFYKRIYSSTNQQVLRAIVPQGQVYLSLDLCMCVCVKV